MEEMFRDHKEVGDCLELALSSHVVENNFIFGGGGGGGGDSCYGHEGETKLNTISMAWDSSVVGSCNSSRSTLSLAHGNFMDKTDDGMSMVKEDHLSLSSFQHTTVAANAHYSSLASEDESTWSPKDALINTTNTRAQFDNLGPKPDQRSVGLMLNLSREFSSEAAAIGESSWIGSRKSKEWTPKIAARNQIKAKDSYNDHMDHQALDYGVGSRTATRVCVDCKTTKTPLWRSGPHGPKSLCNACGIRYRKARRALAAFGNADHMAVAYNSRLPKRKQLGEERVNKFVHFKKRSRLSIPSCKKNINVKFGGNPRVFAEDEKEAAVLLMSLSCGLVHV